MLRCRIRTLMVVVGMSAALAWCATGLYRRWLRIPEYRTRANNHAELLRAHLTFVFDGSRVASPAELAEANRKRYAYHTALKRQYERAATFPWQWMPPDPPDPAPLCDDKTGRRVNLHYDR
jgi:hypothetical protein